MVVNAMQPASWMAAFARNQVRQCSLCGDPSALRQQQRDDRVVVVVCGPPQR
jgi:hypothetical protein